MTSSELSLHSFSPEIQRVEQERLDHFKTIPPSLHTSGVPCHSFIIKLSALGPGHSGDMPNPKELPTGRGHPAGAGGLTQPNPILTLNALWVRDKNTTEKIDIRQEDCECNLPQVRGKFHLSCNACQLGTPYFENLSLTFFKTLSHDRGGTLFPGFTGVVSERRRQQHTFCCSSSKLPKISATHCAPYHPRGGY